MDAREKLLTLVKSRSGSGRFGYGITTADRYVNDAIKALGKGAALAAFGGPALGFDNAIKRAAGVLTCCDENTKQEQVQTGIAAMKKVLGADPPKHAMMAIVNRLTTPREDRDGDTLQTAGARLDPKAPMLFQHLHEVLIGKMVRKVEQTKDVLRVASVLLDINEVTHDVGIMFEAEALRFSHGFIPIKFEERKGGPMARFNILEYDIVEESAVSVPSNVDAEVELFSRGKLSSNLFKAHAKSLFDARTKSMPVTAAAKEAVGDSPEPITTKTASSMRKMFDVATERLHPCQDEHDWAARYIGCSVKELREHTTNASGMMIGAFLAGVEAVAAKYKVTDTRNMTGGGSESPPVHEVVEVSADSRKTFLVEGIRFGTAKDHRLVWRTWKGWGQQYMLIYTDNDAKAIEFIDEVWQWVERNNPLKGQAFALAGGWIKKTGTAWEDVFLEKNVEDALRRTVRIINEKGADAANRGIVLSGPPGTGKTLSARVMLNEADATYIWVSAKDFWKLGPYSAFAGAFELARALAPSVICFEDVDNWIDSYTVDLLKGEMDGLSISKGVTTVLTTNFPDDLPSALIDRPGRFHDVLEVHLPTREVRVRMLSKWAAGAALESIDAMADSMDGYSGAHIYELCHFAKSIMDEDDCSLDDALTKAFDKVKEQRDLINQNQLAGSSYRPGRRELEDAITKGWKGKSMATMSTKEAAVETTCLGCGKIADVNDGGYCSDCASKGVKAMGECKECGEKAELNADGICPGCAEPEEKAMGECKGCGKASMLDDDGMCAKCAKAAEEGEEPDGDEDKGKGTKPRGTKAGRVLSQRNFDALSDVVEDLAEASKMDIPRPAKALVTGCMGKIKSVIDSAGVKPDKPEEDEPEEKTAEDRIREAVELVNENRSARERMRKLIATLDKIDRGNALAEEYRELTSSG